MVTRRTRMWAELAEDPDYDPTKVRQGEPSLRLSDPVVARTLALEAVYRNFTIEDIGNYLNIKPHFLTQEVERYFIPRHRANDAKFFDPGWRFDAVGFSEKLGVIVENPATITPPAGSESMRGWPSALADSKHTHIPLAGLALAQYKLGWLPADICEEDSIAFRDGDVHNLRPENLVYTGKVRLQHPTFKARFRSMRPLWPYRTKCNRCGYRLPEDQEPIGWEFESEFVEDAYATAENRRRRGATRIGKGVLCPVCKNFKDRVWNGSQG